MVKRLDETQPRSMHHRVYHSSPSDAVRKMSTGGVTAAKSTTTTNPSPQSNVVVSAITKTMATVAALETARAVGRLGSWGRLGWWDDVGS